jgi:hypothetical protein
MVVKIVIYLKNVFKTKYQDVRSWLSIKEYAKRKSY